MSILLGLPAIEIYTTIWLAGRIGWGWLLFWFLATAVVGGMLVRHESASFSTRFFFAARGGDVAGSLLDSGRRLLAGVLLIFPGVISDVIALLLLISHRPPAGGETVVRDNGVIEGEFRRED